MKEYYLILPNSQIYFIILAYSSSLEIIMDFDNFKTYFLIVKKVFDILELNFEFKIKIY